MNGDCWTFVSHGLPPFGEPVCAKIKHCDDGALMDVSLVRVDESDCTWRTLDDNSELSFSWSVVSWRNATHHDKLTARHTKADTWLDYAIDKCEGDFTREELMLEAVYQSCCLVHKNPTDYVNGIRRVLGIEVPKEPEKKTPEAPPPEWFADACSAAAPDKGPLFTQGGVYPYDASGSYMDLEGRVVVVLAPNCGKPYRLVVRTLRGSFTGRLPDDVHLGDRDLKPHVGDTATIRVYAPGVKADDVITHWESAALKGAEYPNYRRRESLTGED